MVRTTEMLGADGETTQVEDTRICVVMVGLPARGKSFISTKGSCFTDFSFDEAVLM